MDIRIELKQERGACPQDEKSLGFGKLFSDHMFIVEFDKGQGWHDARIVPLQRISLHPASPVLHYSQEIFEGLKAYRLPNGEISLFRPEENAKRMNDSAYRCDMAQLDVESQLQAMKLLVDIERNWVPKSPGTSLYLRPTMIADGAELGAHSAHRYIYYIIASPSGSYYKNGMKPTRIRIEDRYVRAVKGGMGSAKTGGNYAASFLATAEALAAGFDQVLWLDGREGRYVEEVGAMNMAFVIDGVLVTPNLTGSILPGITRRSVLQLAGDLGIPAEERPVALQELIEAFENKTLTEAFGMGTAAVISPVGELDYHGLKIVPGNGEIGPVTSRLYDALCGIQYGLKEDPYGWTMPVPRQA